MRYIGYAVNILDQGSLVRCNGDRCLFNPSERGTHAWFSHLDMAGSCRLTLVLLRGTRVYWGKLYSLFFLQRFRHLEGSRRAPAEPQKVSGIERYRIEDIVSCVVKLGQWSESRLCCVQDREYNSSAAQQPQLQSHQR